MSRSLLIGAAALAVAAVMPQLPASAQDRASAIIVTGPRTAPSGEAKVGVHPTMTLVSQVTVPTDDLDLRTAYGRDVLDHRVELAAREVCSQIDTLVPVHGLGPDRNIETRDCRIEARKSALSQVRAALWAAG